MFVCLLFSFLFVIRYVVNATDVQTEWFKTYTVFKHMVNLNISNDYVKFYNRMPL